MGTTTRLTVEEFETLKTGSQMAIREVTPDMATYILEHYGQENFRKLNSRRVSQYAEQMRNGDWDAKVSPVHFMEGSGQLTNGQHRMHALIKADVPVELTLFFGMSAEVTAFYDAQQSARTPMQHMADAGFKFTGAASTLAMVWQYNNGYAVGGANDWGAAGLRKMLAETPEFSEYANEADKAFKGLRRPVYRAAAIILLAAGHTLDGPDGIREFARRIDGEGKISNSPCYHIRQAVDEAGMGQKGNRRAFAVILKGHREWYNGDSRQQMWRSDLDLNQKAEKPRVRHAA